MRARVAVIGIALVLGAGSVATSAGAATPLARWKLAVDLRAHPDQNQFAAYSGGPVVWSLRQSQNLDRHGFYTLLPTYSPTFGSLGISAWHGSSLACVKVPAIGVNTTNKPVPLCAAIVPAGAAFVRPSGARKAVVAWTSPATGSYTISHDSVGDIDPTCGDGVSYYVDFGMTELSSTKVDNGGAATLSASTLTIAKGQSLFFIVDPGPNANGTCDMTQLQVTIDRVV